MYDFKQAVRINFTHKGKPQSQSFIRGRHHVSDDILASEDFLHFVNCGWIAEADAVRAQVPLETFHERAQRLAKKLAEKHLPVEPVREPVQENAEVEEEDPGEEVPEEKLTPAQKAARTRAANKAKAEKGE